MNNLLKFLSVSLFLIVCSFGLKGSAAVGQLDVERESKAVVRNKLYYKPGKFELAATGGILPYDDINNQYFLGGKASWHLSDNWGWEILDLQKSFSSVTGWATNLVNSKGLTNLQTARLKYLATSNLLFSPFYGKVRMFGSSLVYFDLYAAVGGGLASTETVKLSSSAPNQSTVRDGWDPVIDFGIGFKFFLNNSMGLVLDLRDYLVFTETYGKRSPKSNYTVFLGLNFFIPNF